MGIDGVTDDEGRHERRGGSNENGGKGEHHASPLASHQRHESLQRRRDRRLGSLVLKARGLIELVVVRSGWCFAASHKSERTPEMFPLTVDVFRMRVLRLP